MKSWIVAVNIVCEVKAGSEEEALRVAEEMFLSKQFVIEAAAEWAVESEDP